MPINLLMTRNFRVDTAKQNQVVNPSQWTPDKHSEEGEIKQSREQITDPSSDKLILGNPAG